MTRDFKKLDIWKESFNVSKNIYSITSKFPEKEKFGIISQLRRASASIGANIAEGCGRQSEKDFVRFLYIAFGSIKECEHFLLLSKDLKYLNTDNFNILNENLNQLAKKS